MKHDHSFTVIDTPTARNLRRALNLLETRGWIQGRAESSLGHCMIGAVAKVTTDTSFPPLDSYDFFMARKDLAAQCNNNTVFWNDTPGRTFAEVREVFLKAIEAANAQ